MVNEEVSSKACNLAVRTTKLTLHVIINALKEQARKAEQRRLHKADEPPHGKQTIKELIGQGQGVTSVDVSKTELKGFQKIAKKYGVDFAVVKDKNNEPPIYTVFFKAKDQDAINNVIREYTNKKMKQKSKPSVLEKLKKFKDKANYIYMYNRFVRPTFGKRKIAEIRYSDVKEFYFSVLKDGIKANTLENIHTVVHPALQLAVRDGLIVNNPSDSAMTEIKRSKLWDAPKRRALTIPQQKAFINYLESDREYEGWLPIITVLLGTGMRIGECIALRWEDLDFENRMISVNHNLSDRPDSKGVCAKHIQTPKTEAGTRTIPMIQEVFEAFLTEYEIQKCLGFCEEEIDGYSGFVFTTAYHTVYSAAAVNNAIHRATKAYNDKEEKEAKKDGREPLLLPDFSAHHLRHTFCTRLCENETNLKVIMDIMGHADISTTMDIYAECTKEKKKEVMTNIEGCIIIK